MNCELFLSNNIWINVLCWRTLILDKQFLIKFHCSINQCKTVTRVEINTSMLTIALNVTGLSRRTSRERELSHHLAQGFNRNQVLFSSRDCLIIFQHPNTHYSFTFDFRKLISLTKTWPKFFSFFVTFPRWERSADDWSEMTMFACLSRAGNDVRN